MGYFLGGRRNGRMLSLGSEQSKRNATNPQNIPMRLTAALSTTIEPIAANAKSIAAIARSATFILSAYHGRS